MCNMPRPSPKTMSNTSVPESQLRPQYALADPYIAFSPWSLRPKALTKETCSQPPHQIRICPARGPACARDLGNGSLRSSGGRSLLAATLATAAIRLGNHCRKQDRSKYRIGKQRLVSWGSEIRGKSATHLLPQAETNICAVRLRGRWIYRTRSGEDKRETYPDSSRSLGRL